MLDGQEFTEKLYQLMGRCETWNKNRTCFILPKILCPKTKECLIIKDVDRFLNKQSWKDKQKFTDWIKDKVKSGFEKIF